LVKVSPSDSTSALCLRIIRTGENAADKSRFPVTDGLSGARRGGFHYLYDGPLDCPEESGWDGKGGTVSIISALLFIPRGVGGRCAEGADGLPNGSFSERKVRFRYGREGAWAAGGTPSRRTSCTTQKKVGMPIGETTVIVNEYLRNHTKSLVSWWSVQAFIASSWCMKLGKRGTK
jgi:hypothetical protein